MKTTKIMAVLMACSFMLMLSCLKKEPGQYKGPQIHIPDTRTFKDETLGAMETGTYKFVTDVTYGTTNRTIGVVGASLDAGAKIEQRDFETYRGHEWAVNNLGNGEYNIINITSGKALSIPAGAAAPGVQLEQADVDNNNSAQKWEIVYIGNGDYQIRSKLKPGLGVNLQADSSENGAKVTLNTLNNSKSYFLAYLVAYHDKAASDFFKRNTGWVGGDGGFSIPLTNNRVVWTFGDSYLNSYDPATGTIPCIYAIHNAVIVQQHDNWNPAQAPTIVDNASSNKTLFKLKDAPNDIYWPASGVQIGDTVYVYTSGLMPDSGPDAWLGFSPTKYNVIYKLKYPEMTLAGYKVMEQSLGQYTFGIGYVKDDASGYVYVYGQSKIILAVNVHVARFPISNPNARWTFWDGTNWVDDVNKSASIGIGDSPGTSACKVKNKYVIFSTEITFQCDNGKKIFASVSDNVTGPFTPRKAVYSIDDRYQGHTPFYYVSSIHPEYVNDKNELLVTYAISGYAPCVPNCVGGKFIRDHFIVEAIRVPLKVIDCSF